MFYLCTASAVDFITVLGRPASLDSEEILPKYDNLTTIIIGQSPDCTSYLFLADTVVSEFTQQTSVPEGYDFTFRQEWGLVITEETIHRVIDTLRKEAYPPMADYLDAKVKGDLAQEQKYLDDCAAVKLKYPKFSF